MWDKSITGEGIIAADLNSLYPSAMVRIDLFPDATSAKWVGGGDVGMIYNLLRDKIHFVAHCDVYLPRGLKFIPVIYKTKKKAFYCTGDLTSVWYCDVDISEII